MTQTRQTAYIRGRQGEETASKFLTKQGCKIIATNFTSKFGEIDIIAQTPNQHIAFIEVKTYTGNNYTHPLEMITKSKQKKIIKTAQYFIFKNNLTKSQFQFDIILINSTGKIEYLQNTF